MERGAEVANISLSHRTGFQCRIKLYFTALIKNRTEKNEEILLFSGSARLCVLFEAHGGDLGVRLIFDEP